MNDNPMEPSGKHPVSWGERMQRLRAGVRRSAPFAAGVLAALAALVLYNVLFPPARPLTSREVRQVMDETMASATPPPAYSTLVYQAIRPSLVLIQTHSAGEDGLGSGVIVDDAGDILTSLHVVAKATDIKITFSDGTEAARTDDCQPARERHCRRDPRQPAGSACTCSAGKPGRHARR